MVLSSRRKRGKRRKVWQAKAWFYLLAEIAENAERFGQAKAWFYILAENAEKIVPRITGITRIRQAKAWFYLLAEIAENADFTIHSQ